MIRIIDIPTNKLIKNENYQLVNYLIFFFFFFFFIK